MDPSTLALGAAAAIGGGLGAVAIVTRFGARIRGSFGSGFVGFRGDGWPRGVQEDDDARWTWVGSATPARERSWLASSRAVPPTAPQRH